MPPPDSLPGRRALCFYWRPPLSARRALGRPLAAEGRWRLFPGGGSPGPSGWGTGGRGDRRPGERLPGGQAAAPKGRHTQGGVQPFPGRSAGSGCLLVLFRSAQSRSPVRARFGGLWRRWWWLWSSLVVFLNAALAAKLPLLPKARAVKLTHAKTISASSSFRNLSGGFCRPRAGGVPGGSFAAEAGFVQRGWVKA